MSVAKMAIDEFVWAFIAQHEDGQYYAHMDDQKGNAVFNGPHATGEDAQQQLLLHADMMGMQQGGYLFIPSALSEKALATALPPRSERSTPEEP